MDANLKTVVTHKQGMIVRMALRKQREYYVTQILILVRSRNEYPQDLFISDLEFWNKQLLDNLDVTKDFSYTDAELGEA